jgi:hypothetical protein
MGGMCTGDSTCSLRQGLAISAVRRCSGRPRPSARALRSTGPRLRALAEHNVLDEAADGHTLAARWSPRHQQPPPCEPPASALSGPREARQSRRPTACAASRPRHQVDCLDASGPGLQQHQDMNQAVGPWRRLLSILRPRALVRPFAKSSEGASGGPTASRAAGPPATPLPTTTIGPIAHRRGHAWQPVDPVTDTHR